MLRSEVSRQVMGPLEGHAAGGAGVGAGAGMAAHVVSQAAGLREGLAAGRAGVWAVASMDAHVISQALGRQEGLAADGARQVEIATRLAPPPLARRSRAPSRSVSRRLFLPPLRKLTIHSPYGRQYCRDIGGFLRIRYRKVA